tara:strand:+ start:1623 stop:1973 length:351 start_codon:yes stop_codon:yes gene_type:complete
MSFTFPSFKPEYNYSVTFETKRRIVALGDGFTHRSLFGLPQNQIITSADLTFNVSETEADTIFTFLRERDLDQKSFLFTLPDETVAKRFICIGQRKTIPYLKRAKIILKFQQVFET